MSEKKPKAAPAAADAAAAGTASTAAAVVATPAPAPAPAPNPAPAPAADAVPKGYWKKANGTLVPEGLVQPVDRARDELVRDLVAQAEAMSALLRDFKLGVMTQIATFVEMSAAQYGAALGGEKGNVSLVTFDGSLKVVRQISETLAFDERLQAAKAIVDACVVEWAKGANANIKALVQHAFQTDKAGQVNTGRVLSLRAIDIDDDRWRQAMKAIADSMHAASTKPYVRMYRRAENGTWVAIPLDAASV